MKSLQGSTGIFAVVLFCTGLLHAQSSAQTRSSDAAQTVLEPTANRLAFVQQPTNAQAAQAITPAITVQVRDNGGKDVAQAGLAVTLTLSSGTGTLSGTTTRSTNTSGRATFDDISINLIGSKQVRAAASGLTSATSSTFSITLGPAVRLRIATEPSSSATAGVTFSQQPVLYVEDAGGNRVTTDNSTVVTAERLAGTGTLQGILTATASSGTVRYSSLSHSVADTISILFSSGALKPDTSRNIIINPAAAARLAFVQQPSNATAGAVIAPAVTVALTDAFGNRVTTTGTSITMALASGTGVLSGTLTRTTSSGVATFSNLSVNLIGSKTLRASSGSLTAAVSNAFTISAGRAKTLAFVQQPTTAASGAAISPAVTVQLRDSLGNNVAEPATPIALALASGTGVLSGTTTRPTDATGLATFTDLSINLSGTKTLSASSSGLVSATSASFTITAGPASRLEFTQQPTNTVAGASISPAVTIQVKDAQGNNVRTSGVSVSIALTSGTGTLTGTLVQPTDANGLATFGNLILNLVGAKNLTPSSAGLTSLASNEFTITPGAANKLAFTTSPGGGTAGTAFTVQPVVTLQDAFGNSVSGVAQTVTLAIQNNAGPGGTLLGTKSATVNQSNGRATFSGITIDKAGVGYTLTATGSTVSTTPGNVVSTSFSVTSGLAIKVRVENAADGTGVIIGNQNVTSGTSITLHAIARDTYDNFVLNIAAGSWTLVSSTGGVVPADLVPSADRKSATFTGRLTGTAVVGAVVSGLSTVASGTLTVVVAGTPTQVRVETAANGTGTIVTDRSVTSGSTLTVYAVGRDGAGNFISNLSSDSWSLQNKTGGVVDGDLVASADKKSAAFTGRLLGTARIRATSGTLTTTTSGTLTVVAGAAATIAATAGTPQSAHVGTGFPTRFAARVRDAAGNPAKAVLVTWTAPDSGASGTFAAGGSAATTDSNGIATAGVFTANILAGTYTVRASLPSGMATAVYSLTNTYGVPARIGTAAGSPQSARVTQPFLVPLRALITDSSGNAVGGVTVTFTAPANGPSGTFSGGNRIATAATAASGIATAPAFIANSLVGTYQVVATATGVANGTAFDLTNTSGAPGKVLAASGTPQSTLVGTPFTTDLKAIVQDSSGNSLSGVRVIFTAPSSGASGQFVTGLADSAITDATGTATASTLTANGVVGTFTVLAQALGVASPASFVLTNQTGSVDTFLIDAAGGGSIGTKIAQVPFQIRIRANDRFGNVATSFSGTADISSNGVLAPAGTRTSPFSAGVLASHTVTMQQSGRFILMATRTGGAEIGRSDTFDVFNPAPVIAKISPSVGRRGQSLSVTVTGSGFLTGVTTASFGNKIATSTTVISDTAMTVMVDIDTAATVGNRDVYVFNGAPGGGVATLANAFQVIDNPKPGLTSLNPSTGTVLQQLKLVVVGTNFYDDITRLNMGAGIEVDSMSFDSTTQLTATIQIAASAAGGTRQVFVSNEPPGGGISQSLTFIVTAPVTPYPVPEAPVEDAPGIDTVVVFRWHSWLATGITYHLQVSTSSTFTTTVVDDSTIADTLKQVTSLARGVKHYWRVFARNAVGTSEPSPTRSFTPSFVYPSSIEVADSIWFPTYASGGDYKAREYRLIGLPGNCSLPINTLLPGTKEVDWVVYWDNGATSNYLVPFDGTATFTFTPGRAFWVLNRGPIKIRTTIPTIPLDSARSVMIPLHPGWNTITNPFLSPIQWSSVESANGAIDLPDIWTYAGSFTRSSVLTPCIGYLYDNADNRAVLRIPLGWAASKSPAIDDPAAWRIHMRLSSGDVTDAATSIGVSPKAERGRDLFDLRMPRGVGQEPGVFFERAGWDPEGSVFATDIKTTVDAIETWPMSVRAVVREQAQLSFSGMGDVPGKYRILLIDDEHSRLLDLRNDSVYSFTPARPVSQFRVVVGTQEATQTVLDDLLPKEFALGTNFPNPFNPTTTIPVAVPRASAVALTLYTILGEEVRTLFEGTLEPGRHWFAWDGKDSRGFSVASGVYLIRLTTDVGRHFTGKMLLMR